ncbi:MAG: GAF domain-containing protein [Chloroflexi bacterium]|nr:GAF domain-containing protein [Chloroflexota bacterium]
MSDAIHELKTRLAAVERDSHTDIREQIDLLNTLARKLTDIDPAGGLNYSHRAYELSQSGPFATQPYALGLATSLLMLGVCNYQLGNYGKTLSLLLEGKAVAEAGGNLQLQAELLLNIAKTYNILGDLPVATDYLVRAIELCEETAFQQGEAEAYRVMGVIHHRLANHQRGLNAFRKALKIERDIGNKPGEAALLNDIGVQYCTLKDFNNALDSACRSLALSQELQLDMLEANVLCTIGEIYFALGDGDQALAYFEHSIVLSRRLGFKYVEMFAMMMSGEVHLRRDRVNQSLPCLHQALAIAHKIDTKAELYRCHQLLARAYKRQSDFETALFHQEQFHMVYETVFNEEADTRARNLQIAHDTETAQKEAEIYRLKNVELEQEIAKRHKFEQELQNSHDRLWALRRTDFELTSELAVNHVLSVALESAMQLSDAQAGGIWLAEGDNFRLVQPAGHYPAELIGSCLPTESGIFARVILQQHAELIPNVAADLATVPIVAGISAMLALPLLSRQRLVGVLSLEAVEPNGFASDTFDTLSLLAARIAVAIDNAQAHEELEHLVAELDAFAHTVAHDLKNPLTVAFGFAETLRTTAFDCLTEDDFNESMDTISDSVIKMNSIIDALLLLARVRTTDEVDIDVIDTPTLVRAAQQRLRHLVHPCKAEITVPTSWPAARGYAPWVEEIWCNYLSNALKYGGHPPRIELGADVQPNDMVRFWIRDNGPGLKPDEQALLFTPFSRLNRVKVEGQGLGLSIVQRIVEKLGGQVGVDSQPGHGSVFSFTLPLAESKQIP